jgi:nucleotide-binding universal stress UspA family protein
MHVIDPYCYPFGEGYTALHAGGLMAEARAGAQGKLKAMAAQAGVHCATLVSEGSPAIAICKAASKDVDLIITPTHGRTGLGHILIGSVAERVVRCAHCPVLVVPVRSKLVRHKTRD